ncbi:hypothetical protein BD408DRAFT_412529 [Parasitella parasitica]|nr:hypothetical protein BD408DRAFT_412529 [Parasitella parasitica]
MDASFWEKLKKEIHDKVVESDYCDAGDETLSDNIVAMIQAETPSESINNDLLNLVGSDYDLSLTEWFLERRKELESTKEPAIDSKSFSLVRSPTPERSRSKSIARGNRFRSRSNSSSRRSRSPNVSFDRRRSRSRDSHKRRSRSPYRQAHRSSSRYKRRYSATYYERYSRSSELCIGNCNSHRRDHKQSRLNVFDRLGPVKIPLRNETERIRCKYWPKCNKSDTQCKFFHPTKVCRDFPHCQKRLSECCFVHPQVDTLPISVKPIIRIPSPCRFYPYCANPVCPFLHILTVAPQQTCFIQYANIPPKVLLPCHKGANCQIQNCGFLHPKDPKYYARQVCNFDGTCQNADCVYRHTKLGSQSTA